MRHAALAVLSHEPLRQNTEQARRQERSFRTQRDHPVDRRRRVARVKCGQNDVANLGGTLPDVIERIDHLSVTRTPDAPLPSSRARRVHVDCSSLGPRAIEIAAAVFGADHIVFGTDCPIFRTDWTFQAISRAQISETEKEGIRTANAARLLSPLWPELGG